MLHKGSHSFTCHQTRAILDFTPRQQSIAAFLPVLIAPTQEGMARLCWHDSWLDQDIFPTPGVELDTVTNRASRRQLRSSDQLRLTAMIISIIINITIMCNDVLFGFLAYFQVYAESGEQKVCL